MIVNLVLGKWVERGEIVTQDMATYLVPRRVLNPVEWDHITMVSESHIKTGKHLSLIIVQVGGVSQLTRDVGKKGRGSSLMMRGGRTLVGGWHCVRISE